MNCQIPVRHSQPPAAALLFFQRRFIRKQQLRYLRSVPGGRPVAVSDNDPVIPARVFTAVETGRVDRVIRRIA